jgi:hypothetical protein
MSKNTNDTNKPNKKSKSDSGFLGNFSENLNKKIDNIN